MPFICTTVTISSRGSILLPFFVYLVLRIPTNHSNDIGVYSKKHKCAVCRHRHKDLANTKECQARKHK